MAANKGPAEITPPRVRVDQYGLTISPYERVASLVVTLLILVGMSVVLLFTLWLTSRLFVSNVAVPVTWEQIGEGGGLGGDTELETDSEELSQDAEFEEPEFEDTLVTIADAVATKAALLEVPTYVDQTGTAKGGSKGDGRSAGFGPGRPGKPRHWEVIFLEGNTTRTYARQLDYFRIEMGVLMPGNKVEYAINFSKDKPDRRSGPADAEQRYYLTWQKGGLREADLELLAKGGVNAGDRPIIKFMPPELELQLMELEKQRAGKREKQILATYFAIRPKGSGYEFFVQDQTYKY
ncbi:MAG: hypothetical protein ACYC6Y_19585 [Thermoguttaceae bacterium]